MHLASAITQVPVKLKTRKPTLQGLNEPHKIIGPGASCRTRNRNRTMCNNKSSVDSTMDRFRTSRIAIPFVKLEAHKPFTYNEKSAPTRELYVGTVSRSYSNLPTAFYQSSRIKLEYFNFFFYLLFRRHRRDRLATREVRTAQKDSISEF